LQIAIDDILKNTGLEEIIEVSIQEKREKKKINAYAGKPARIESKSIFQLHIQLNAQAG